MNETPIDKIYNIIDLCKYAEVDGEKAELKIGPYKENSRIIRIGLNNGFSRDCYEYVYENGEEFDLKVMPLIVNRFLEKDAIRSWVTKDPEVEGYPSKELIVTENGNECLIQTYDKNFHENFKTTVEEASAVATDMELTYEEKSCEKVLKYLKEKYKPRKALDELNPALRQEIIQIVENAYYVNKGRTLTDEQIYNFAYNIEQGISKEAFDAIANDIRNNNSELINDVRNYLKNERFYENYLDEEPYMSLSEVGTTLIENGYFNIRYAFPQKTDLDNLTEETLKEIITGEYKSKYKFLSEQKEAFEKNSNVKASQVVDYYMNYLVKTTRSKVNRNRVKKEEAIKFNDSVEEYKKDDPLTMIDAVRLYKGGKLDDEKFEVIVEENEESYKINLRITNGLSRDNNVFLFTKNDTFKNEILPALMNEFTALDAIKETNEKGDKLLITTYTGNDLLINNSLLNNVDLSSKDKEDYQKLDNRKEEDLTPYELKLKEELASKNEAIGEYQRKEDEFKTGAISEEELLAAREKLIKDETPKKEEKKEQTSSPNIVTSAKDIDYGINEKKGLLDGDSKYLASYFRKEILRDKGMLPPRGLQEIENLVNLSEDVKNLEKAREDYNSGKITKDKYTAIHDKYRALLAEAIKNKAKIKEDVKVEAKKEPKKNDKFDYLHDLAIKYKVQNVDGELRVFDRAVNSEVLFKNEKQLQSVEFANFWNSALGLKSSKNDVILGEKYAFNEDNRKLFEIISNNLTGDILRLDTIKEEFKNSKIDNQDIIFDRLFKNNSYVHYVTKGIQRFNSTYNSKVLDIIEKNKDSKEICDAYEIAESYSDDNQTAFLKLNVPKDDKDKMEVYVSHGKEQDETTIYEKTFDKEYFMEEVLPGVVDGFNNISGILKLNSYSIPDTDRKVMIAIGGKDSILQATNVDNDDIEAIREAVKAVFSKKDDDIKVNHGTK